MLPAAIASIGHLFRVIEDSQIENWEGKYRSAPRMPLKEILELA